MILFPVLYSVTVVFTNVFTFCIVDKSTIIIIIIVIITKVYF